MILDGKGRKEMCILRLFVVDGERNSKFPRFVVGLCGGLA